MFGFFNKNEPHPVDQPIKRVLDEMEMMGPDHPEYKSYVKYLEKLTKLKREERKPLVNPDTMLTVGGTLLGIALVAAFETKHVWTSKALQVGSVKNRA